MKSVFALVLGMALPLASLGCTVEDQRVPDNPKGPGKAPWNHDDDISCEVQDDCGEGETCQNGVCQMATCIGEYESLSPLGLNKYFGVDGEFTVISDDTWIDAFDPHSSQYINSWDLSGAGGKVVDVAGGDLDGSRPMNVAVAIEYSDTVKVKTATGIKDVFIGIWPKAIAAGDIDADQIDELVSLGEDGSISICHVDVDECYGAKLDGVVGKDVAVADVDGDGFGEAIFLIDYQGESEVIIYNPDFEKTGQEESYGWRFNFPVVAMSAGRITGAEAAEIVLLEDGGWWNWADDKLYLFQPSSEAFIANRDIPGRTKDIAVGDRDTDEDMEIAVLTDDKKIQLLDFGQDQTLQLINETIVTTSNTVNRISMVDWDGDSPSGRLLDGPVLIPGKAVPIAAMMFPPYPADVAVGALSANITLGDVESSAETMSDTVSLGASMGISFGAEAFGFKAKVGGYFSKDFSYTERVQKTFITGARYWILAQTDLFGESYAPIIMSCACYHEYTYQLEDPSNILGGDGTVMTIYVPVGGETQLWSSKRYNAMAKAVGDLPLLEVPVRVGDKGSYPAMPMQLDGSAINPDDMVFPETQTYQLSDVGFVSFWLQSGETLTNEVAESTELGVTGSLGAGVVEVNGEVTAGWTQAYSISVGKSSLWAGSIPPVPDNPETPEDEYDLHRYNFQPFVYRQRYTDYKGEEAGFYVMHFAVTSSDF